MIFMAVVMIVAFLMGWIVSGDSKLYNIPSTGLRVFTVYGRPDLAYFKFTELLRNGKNIDIYNFGNCQRDFTYIDRL